MATLGNILVGVRGEDCDSPRGHPFHLYGVRTTPRYDGRIGPHASRIRSPNPSSEDDVYVSPQVAPEANCTRAEDLEGRKVCGHVGSERPGESSWMQFVYWSVAKESNGDVSREVETE